MAKLLLAVAAVVSMSFSQGGSDRMVKMSIRPDPPVQGKSATLTGPPGQTIDLDWDPAAEPSSITLGRDGKATFTVPSNATSLIATDEDGNTEAWSVSKP